LEQTAAMAVGVGIVRPARPRSIVLHEVAERFDARLWARKALRCDRLATLDRRWERPTVWRPLPVTTLAPHKEGPSRVAVSMGVEHPGGVLHTTIARKDPPKTRRRWPQFQGLLHMTHLQSGWWMPLAFPEPCVMLLVLTLEA